MYQQNKNQKNFFKNSFNKTKNKILNLFFFCNKYIKMTIKRAEVFESLPAQTKEALKKQDMNGFLSFSLSLVHSYLFLWLDFGFVFFSQMKLFTQALQTLILKKKRKFLNVAQKLVSFVLTRAHQTHQAH